MKKNPYTTDELVTLLQLFWARAEGLEYGHEHEVMRCAAEKLQELSAYRIKLERKIRNQRRACRETWEIVEMRQRWMGSPASRKRYHAMYMQYRDLLRKTHGMQS
jgi:hypothetical protein